MLFYHSHGADRCRGRGRGGRAYPDRFQFKEAGHKYEDPKSSPRPPPGVPVDIRFVERFDEVVPLATATTKGLEQMMVTQRGSRLSIQPVRPAEAQVVLKLGR
ncbi:MAG: EVE domain-containing protein [Planctomycetota bacterium]